jgi:AcrR family transcriptional regulator
MDRQLPADQKQKRNAQIRRFYSTAASVFARKGYHETMGIAKGTIYYNFENKEDLYVSVIQEGVNRFKQQLQQAVDAGRTTLERIANLISCQLNFFEHEPALVSLFLTELFGNDPLRSHLASQMLSDCLQIFRACIKNGIEDGSLCSIDQETATSSLFGMIVISALRYTYNQLPIPIDQVASDIGKIFFGGTCTRPVSGATASAVLPDEPGGL